MSDDKPKHAGGRPSIYTPELVDKICTAISSSHYGLEKLCRLNPELPHPTTIRQWASDNPEFSSKYEAAFEQQSTLLFKGAIDELESLDECTYINPLTGAQEINSGMIAFKKALSDRKAKHAAVLNKKYRIQKEEDNQDPDETINKIRDLVAGFNKTNTSDI